ncbi:MAG: hypothetical protein IKH18_00245 [Clostridia bacterium]|nr:hypothetical protein [Clostridia bacterium]
MFDVAIVADGNAAIGMGHIMRSGAVAEALRESGLSLCWIASDRSAESLLQAWGYPLFCLDSDYRQITEQAGNILEILKGQTVRFAFFDSYFASNSLFAEVRKYCPVGCFGYGKNYSEGMDLIVPYGISSDREWYRNKFDGTETAVLFGSSYVPLRKAFWNAGKKDLSGEPKRLMITCGGTDPLNITGKLVKAIRENGMEIRLDVIAGRFFDSEMLEESCAGCSQVTIHKGLNDLSELMRHADLAVSAGGMTLYELMASYVPTVAFSMADNQAGNRLLDGSVVWCGDIRDGKGLNCRTVEIIVENLKRLISSPEDRAELADRGYRQCDGNGARRIARAVGDILCRKESIREDRSKGEALTEERSGGVN